MSGGGLPSLVGSPRALAVRRCQGFRRVLLPEPVVAGSSSSPSPSSASVAGSASFPRASRSNRPAKIRIRDVAGKGVEDAGAGGRVAHAEVVAVEQVVGGGVVQRRRGLALHGEQAVDDEGHHHAAHVAQELGHRQHAARRVRALHHRVLAEGFQRRAGGGPHEVWPADAGVPEVAQLGGDVGLHLAQHGVVPAGAGGARALPTHQPDELDSEGRIKTRLFLLNG